MRSPTAKTPLAPDLSAHLTGGEETLMDVDKWLDILSKHSSNSRAGDVRPLEGSFYLWRAWCPMHRDQKVQMVIDPRVDDEPRIHCNAGCVSGVVVAFVTKAYIDHRRKLRRSNFRNRPVSNVYDARHLFGRSRRGEILWNR